MNLVQIKTKLGVPSLQLNPCEDSEGNATDWFKHWINEPRTAITIHSDLVDELKAKGNKINSLDIQLAGEVDEETGKATKFREGTLGAYECYRIVKYEEAAVVL